MDEESFQENFNIMIIIITIIIIDLSTFLKFTSFRQSRLLWAPPPTEECLCSKYARCEYQGDDDGSDYGEDLYKDHFFIQNQDLKISPYLHIIILSNSKLHDDNIKDGQDFINNLGMITMDTMLLVIVLGDDDSDEDDNDYNALGRALSATNRDLEKK